MITLAGSENGADQQPAITPCDAPRWLWSLWDIMKQFDASRFVNLSNRVAQFHQLVEQNSRINFHRSDYESLLQEIEFLRDQMRDMGLDAAEISANRLIDILNAKAIKDLQSVRFTEVDSRKIKRFGEDITTRARDQLQSKLFLLIPKDVKELYVQNHPLFGKEVSEKFPSLEYEISEIGKCLALERSTASAFRSVRCLVRLRHKFQEPSDDAVFERLKNWLFLPEIAACAGFPFGL
jgi:hypothetical protein